MIALLPMYESPETRASHDRYWELIRQAAGDGPSGLLRTDDQEEHWRAWFSPELFFGQTCGLPFRGALHRDVELIGTPDYGVVPGRPGYYYSVIIARVGDPRSELANFAGARAAVNSDYSQSGRAALLEVTGPSGADISYQELTSGSHRNSARMVAEGEADFAAIDAVTWRLLEREGEHSPALRVVAETRPTPGLPYITARGRDAAHLLNAVQTAVRELGADDQEALLLQGVAVIPRDAYLAEPLPDLPDMSHLRN